MPAPPTSQDHVRANRRYWDEAQADRFGARARRWPAEEVWVARRR